MTGTLDILTNLELQCLGLWILLRTSSGNDRDSGILVLTSSGNDCSNMRGSRGGRGGPDPSGKSKSYMRFYGNKHLDPLPLEKVGHPLKIASPGHLNYMHENVMITSKVIFKDFSTPIFSSYGTTVAFSIP